MHDDPEKRGFDPEDYRATARFRGRRGLTLEQARKSIGKYVVYRPPGGPLETGIITSVNDEFVFVRYGADRGSKATRPQDLELE